jgi:hypothetical protein
VLTLLQQKLGSLQLCYDDSQEIQLFDWCGLAIKTSSTSDHELTSLKVEYHHQKETISKLSSQLDDLIKSKADHETELLQAFIHLLNEKKSKNRDLQRLLAAANVDPKKLAEIEASLRTGARTAVSSSSRKRKGKESDSDSGGGFEKMDVDVDQVANDSDADDAVTPEPSDDETEDENDKSLSPPSRKPIQDASARTKTIKNSNKNSENLMEDVDNGSIPPPRRLPFAKRKLASQKKTSPAPKAEDEGEETEDDEL